MCLLTEELNKEDTDAVIAWVQAVLGSRVQKTKVRHPPCGYMQGATSYLNEASTLSSVTYT